MPDLYAEMMYRFCHRDIYGHFEKHKGAYQRIFETDSITDDHTLIGPKSCNALWHYLTKQGRCPSSPDALLMYIRSNPDNIPEFERSNAATSEIRELKKSFEPQLEGMDDEVLLNNLKEYVRFVWIEKGMQTSGNIATGAIFADKKETKKGPEAAREWLASYLAKDPFAEPEEGLLTVDTADLDWLGVTTDEDDNAYTLRVQRFSQVQPRELKWLWPGKIPSGKVTIISGKPDNGKSLCLVDWTARVTTGRDWPDGSKNELGPRRVMLCSAEDDPSDTMAPRLIAAGADLDKVLRPVMTVRTKGSGNEYDSILNIKRDLEMLTKVIQNNPDIALLILDPVTSYLGGANLNKDEEIRPLINKLIALGQKTGITILALVHSNKRSDVDAVDKVMGASSVAAGARAVWTIARDTEDKQLFRMGLVKGNIIRKRTGYEYRIVETQVEIDGRLCGHPKLQWEKETDMDANDMLAADREKTRNGSGEDGKLNLAIAVIRETVPGFAKDALQRAEAEGINERTLFRAKKKLGIETDLSRGKGKAFWYVPGEKGDPALKPVVNEKFIPEEVAV